MTVTKEDLKKSVVVKNLADLASQGRYNVDPAGAARMNQLFVLVAQVINELEDEEAAPIGGVCITGDNDDG